MTKQDVLERFASKVEATEDCWNWIGNITPSGYGSFNPSYGVKKYAHRWIYETVVDAIPEGLTIDHLCFNTRCVNPDHLEVVTLGENSRRASARRTACKNGHEWTEDNICRRKDGSRICKACMRDRWHAANPGRPRRLLYNSTDLTKGCPGDASAPISKPMSAIDQSAPFGAINKQEAMI